MEIATYTLEIRTKFLKTEFNVKDSQGYLPQHGEWDFWRKKLGFYDDSGKRFEMIRKGFGNKINFILEDQGLVYGTIRRKKKVFGKDEFFMNIGDIQYFLRSIKSYKHLSISVKDEEVGRISSKRLGPWLTEYGIAIHKEHFQPRLFCLLLALDRYKIIDKKRRSG